jgi:hypothetical protein
MTNPVTLQFTLEVGNTNSAGNESLPFMLNLGEEVQRWAPKAHIVKGFNTLGCHLYQTSFFDHQKVNFVTLVDIREIFIFVVILCLQKPQYRR